MSSAIFELHELIAWVGKASQIFRGWRCRVARRQQAIPKGTASGWLPILAEGEDLSPDFLVRLNYPTAHDLMSAPVITLHEETNLREIAQILSTRRIKSVPVVRDG